LVTDDLEEKYGPVSAKVLRHDSYQRESQILDSRGIARAYNLTFLARPMPKGIKEINEQIRDGQPIGKAFRQNGYAVRKNVLDVFVVQLPKKIRAAFHTEERFAKSRLSEFYAKDEASTPVIYGTVCEIYTPDFRSPIINPVDMSQISAASAELKKRGFSEEEIWQRIGQDNDWGDVQEKHLEARKSSLPVVFGLRKRIEKHLSEK